MVREYAAPRVDAAHDGDTVLWQPVIVLPSDGNLDRAAPYIISNGNDGYYVLRSEMETLEKLKIYDVVLFDHSPSYSAVTESALLASDEMIIPCELGTFSIEGLLQMIDKLTGTLSKRGHQIAVSGIVPCKYNASISMHEIYLKDHMVEDPIAHVRFPKAAAATVLEWSGQKFYFIGEETRREFEKQQGSAAK